MAITQTEIPELEKADYKSLFPLSKDKVIFLDIDGVLINFPSLRENKACSRCVALLNRLTDIAKAKLVVSSTWRKQGLEKVRQQLKTWGVTGEVVGITPVLDRIENGVFVSVSRGNEIQAYLNNHPEVYRFVILDDESDMSSLSRYLVQTEYEIGLGYADICKAKDILNGNNSD